MGISVRRTHAGAALAALLALSAITAGITAESGQARGVTASPISELRIEGPTRNVLPGTWYVTGDESVRRSRGLKCRHTDGREDVPGPTALGIAETASRTDPDLPPMRVRRDDFGLFVCELGGRVGRPFDHPDGFSGWTYWLDFAGGTQSAENEILDGGDRVLWVFSDFGDANLNTGDALELSGVPAYDADGTFPVEVTSHSFGGVGVPLAGATIKGAESVQDLGGGSYEVAVGDGFTTLFARHRPDIASNALDVCVRASAANCPSEHGRDIVGSPAGDGIAGTPGWDRIRSAGGDDEIEIIDGGRDTVNCGGGEDTVTVLFGDADDELAGNCEEIIPAS